MSGPGLFIVGVLVTLIVAGALVLLLYAAVLDGRDGAAPTRMVGDELIPEVDPVPTMVA